MSTTPFSERERELLLPEPIRIADFKAHESIGHNKVLEEIKSRLSTLKSNL